MAQRIEIASSTGQRLYAALVVAASVIYAVRSLATDQVGAIGAAAFVVALAVIAAQRVFRMGAVAEDNGLSVRNFLQSRHFDRCDVKEFDIDRPGWGFATGTAIVVGATNGDEIALDATRRPFASRHSRDVLERHATELRAWLSPSEP